jgi:nitroreductase
MKIQEQTALTQITPVIDLMRAHRSIRKFTPQSIPDGWVETIIESAQWASSTCFRQAYSVIAITDPIHKRNLRQLCGGQRWVEECPIFLAFCADTNRLDDICKSHGKRVNLEHTETFLMAALDVALFMQNAALVTESLGLGVVMIGGLRDHAREVIELLQLPYGSLESPECALVLLRIFLHNVRAYRWQKYCIGSNINQMDGTNVWQLMTISFRQLVPTGKRMGSSTNGRK